MKIIKSKPVAPSPTVVEIEAGDIGRMGGNAPGRLPHGVIEALGRVLPGDVGKRAYLVPNDDPRTGSTWQVEGDGQRDARVARAKSHAVANDRPFTSAERMTLICACGECGIDPDTWECESSRDPEAKADAYRTLSNREERRGNASGAVRLAALADACGPFSPL